MNPRATPCVFMGYSTTQKGYKVLEIDTNRFFVTRDIHFHEKHFPFHLYLKHSLSPSPYTNAIYLPSFMSPTIFDPPDFTSSANIFPPHSLPVHSPPPTESATSTDSVHTQFNSSPSPTPPPSNTTQTPNNSNSSSESHPNTTHSTDSTSSSSNSSLPYPIIRQSARIHKPPGYLDAYECFAVSSTNTDTPVVTKHWCNLVSYVTFPDEFQAFLSQVCTITEPVSYTQAAKHPLWLEAMKKELEALDRNYTWELVELPKGKKAIGCKWVFKVKLKSTGALERCKARLVAKGYNQKYGIYYEETFSPVVKMSTIRCLLAVAASRKWPLFQLDVNNAFLHGDLKEEVYMQMPEGVDNPTNKVCRLVKSIYGLKQASRQWHEKLLTALETQGFIQSKHDYSLFINKQNGHINIAAVYVDDIILTGTDVDTLKALKAYLHQEFSIKDLGRLNYFLGMEVGYTTDGIILSQKKFTRELIESCGFDTTKRAITPLPMTVKLSNTEGEFYSDTEKYRSLVGKLNFLTHTRPDLSYAVQTLSQFLKNPREHHVAALHHTLRYLAHTEGQGILLKASDAVSLQAFSDSDWASCPDTRRSVTGYILLLGGSPISWKSKKQGTVSKSSAEAEYRAMAAAASEVTWIVNLLEDLGVHHLKPITLHCDNQSALHIAKNPVFHERTKHIEIDCHFTRDKVLEGLLHLNYLPTQQQLADIFTKPLCSTQFQTLLSKIGACDAPS